PSALVRSWSLVLGPFLAPGPSSRSFVPVLRPGPWTKHPDAGTLAPGTDSGRRPTDGPRPKAQRPRTVIYLSRFWLLSVPGRHAASRARPRGRAGRASSTAAAAGRPRAVRAGNRAASS